MNRTEILNTGLKLTSEDRNKTYGDPRRNLGLAGELKEIIRRNSVRELSFGEQEAIDMVLTKISRIVTSPAYPGIDTYIDGATYFAIAGELSQPAEYPTKGTASNTELAKELKTPPPTPHPSQTLGKPTDPTRGAQ